MSLQKAKAEFRTIKMERGELDTYIAKFERLAGLAGYSLQDQMVLCNPTVGRSSTTCTMVSGQGENKPGLGT